MTVLYRHKTIRSPLRAPVAQPKPNIYDENKPHRWFHVLTHVAANMAIDVASNVVDDID